MSADVDLCNQSLDLVGQTTIQSLQDGTPVSQVLLRLFVPTVREVLRDGRWKCARKVMDLTRLADSPGLQQMANSNSTFPQVGGWPPGSTLPVSDSGEDIWAPFLDQPPWAWWFQLPPDYLRIVRFNQQDPQSFNQPLYEINGQVLKCALSSVSLDYVADVTSNPGGQAAGVAILDPMLAKAIVYALAVKLAWRFQQSKVLQDSLRQDAELYLRKARAADARDERQLIDNPAADSVWVRGRWNSTNG